MFAIEIFCEDKNLARVLRALAGSGAIIQSPPRLMENAAIAEGRVAQKGEGALKDLVLTELSDSFKGKPFKPEDVKDTLKALGFSPLSYSYVLKKLSNDRAVKRKSDGTYSVTMHMKARKSPKGK